MRNRSSALKVMSRLCVWGHVWLCALWLLAAGYPLQAAEQGSTAKSSSLLVQTDKSSGMLPPAQNMSAGGKKGALRSSRNVLEDKPWSDGALRHIHGRHPTMVRVAILNTLGKSKGVGLIAFLFEQYRREHLERKIGKKIAVVNQSRLETKPLLQSIIAYRPGNLRAALIMADVIPGKQIVEPMEPDVPGRIGIDVEIRVGMELP